MRHVLSGHCRHADRRAQRKPQRDARRNPRRAHRQHLPLHRLRAHHRGGARGSEEDLVMTEPSAAVMDFKRRDSRDKLTGRTRYTIDKFPSGLLHASILRAALPSGRILKLDVSKASRMPGVRAIVTSADAPGRVGIGIADHPLFAEKVVRYDGEPLAAVAA